MISTRLCRSGWWSSCGPGGLDLPLVRALEQPAQCQAPREALAPTAKLPSGKPPCMTSLPQIPNAVSPVPTASSTNTLAVPATLINPPSHRHTLTPLFLEPARLHLQQSLTLQQLCLSFSRSPPTPPARLFQPLPLACSLPLVVFCSGT